VYGRVLFPPPACTLTDDEGVLPLLLCANDTFAMAIAIAIAVDAKNIIIILTCFLFINNILQADILFKIDQIDYVED
jgi:hypothetical protein